MQLKMVVKHAPSGVAWTFPVPDTSYQASVAAQDSIGLIPYFLDANDTRPAIAQFAEHYCGGWDAMRGFTLVDGEALKYPGDPLMYPIASCEINGDIVRVYEGSFVCVVRPHQTFEVARMD